MCKDCANAIWDPLMGEYKCVVSHTYVYGANEDCEDYKKGKPVESKMAKDYYEQMGMDANGN